MQLCQHYKKTNLNRKYSSLKHNQAGLKSMLSPSLIPAVGLGTLIVGIWQYSINQSNDRGKRNEDRFQKAVEGLGSDKIYVKAASATILRTFIRPEYEMFSQQIFNLAVNHFRDRKVD